jgi:hypothetical protein
MRKITIVIRGELTPEAVKDLEIQVEIAPIDKLSRIEHITLSQALLKTVETLSKELNENN